MDIGFVILIIIAGIILHGLFLYLIIRWAMRTKRQVWNQKQLLMLLMKIAEKLQVPKSEIRNVEEKMEAADEYL